MTERDQLRAITMGLRHLIQTGEGFRNNYAKELGLGTSDLVALGYVHKHGPTPPGEMGAWMGMTSGTITALLDRIEKAGFVVRSNNPADRRSLLIRITPAGRHAMEWVYEQFDNALEDSLATIPGPPIDQLASILEHLSQALENHGKQ
ncbi:MarR family transcriptional regulator (plasmid) [Arthrobacter sp. YA7-1]|uniref:MarR family winged helix-turn-helix transcriptional regulator n=1 Tax=Arthrobacter sp. YA7-1 TaxID=2987701 RepID=UPI002226D09F|nr:MarR family transcriptional regulator [Arthrobacter sp. YA7-1]UYY83596.1 MarR family transcriptional regulator [Arthrobacter sp. YA7-1]